MEAWGVSLDWKQVNRLVKRFAWGLAVGGNYLWCLAIVTIFKELGGTNR